MSVGLAIAARSGETREIIKFQESQPIIVTVPSIPSVTPYAEAEVKALDIETDLERIIAKYGQTEQATPDAPAIEPPRQSTPVVASSSTSSTKINRATPSGTPAIRDPKVEKMVTDAYRAHMQGDILAALVKLEQAQLTAPDEAAIYYRKAQLFEDMGNWEKAADNYEKLFTMGPQIGIYYQRAALKLTHGINPESSKQGLFNFGNILARTQNDRLSAKLTIPVRVTPDVDFDPNLIEVKVHFYDLVDNKRISAVPPSRAHYIQNRWLDLPADWSIDNEELIESSYSLPSLAEAEVHLFGERKIFGYVAELYYKDELLDQQASPRRLHAIHAEQNNALDILPDQPAYFPPGQLLPALDSGAAEFHPLPRN